MNLELRKKACQKTFITAQLVDETMDMEVIAQAKCVREMKKKNEVQKVSILKV